MLNRVITFSIRHRNWVFVAGACLLLSGLYSWYHLPIDAFPDTTPVQVQINTVAP
ncbi:MAG TPA: efflux RND transporter permease subunit, partial [Candidatus Eisenbacteria bacterium]|nr:efflux RND transporter permease subunit [Candidatus Eisenbacteria bacterium]